MKSKNGLAIALVCCVAGTAGANSAKAFCDTFTADSGNNTIIIAQRSAFSDGMYIPTGQVAICWKDSGGTWHAVNTSCDLNDSQNLLVYAGGGDDTLAPAATSASASSCGGSMLFGFDPGFFTFGVTAVMQGGYDHAYGTVNADELDSNGTFGSPGTDYAIDYLCGYGGDDWLGGDGDNSWNYYEYMNGGSGSDGCDGHDGSNTYDYYTSSCESHWASGLTSSDYCGTAPPNLWP